MKSATSLDYRKTCMRKQFRQDLKYGSIASFKGFNIFPILLNENASYYSFFFFFEIGVNIFHIFKIMSSSTFVFSLIVHLYLHCIQIVYVFIVF